MPKTFMVPEARVAVLPHRAITGINRLEEARSTLEVYDLSDVLNKQFLSDAHMVTYHVEGEEAWPRCNKPVLHQIRTKGLDIKSNLLVFDIDNPGHAAWTTESYVAFDLHLTQVLSQDELLSGYYAFYTTRGGSRLIYLLSESVPVDVQEEMLLGMNQLFAARGLKVDELYDWTRLFRLPWVTRDEKQTWNMDEFPHALLEINPHYKLLPVAQVPQVPIQRNLVTVNPADRIPSDLPDLDTLDALLWKDVAQQSRSDWYQAAKVRLQGREYFGALFRNDLLAEQGGRNQAIFRTVGSATRLLVTLEDTTPQHVFALFRQPVSHFEDDRDNPETWEETLWRAIRLTWEKETAKIAEGIDPKLLHTGLLQELQQNDLVAGILAGIRTWCVELSHLNDEELWGVFENKLVLVGANTFYIMRPNGFYDTSAVSPQQLGSRVKGLSMQSLIPTQYVNDKGKAVQLSPERIGRLCGHTIFDCHGSLQFDQGSWLRDITEERPVVCEPMYSLNPHIVPEFHPEVDTWLRHLAGASYEKLINWIGHCLDFSHPIAALFLQGPPSVGKKMLALGLSENLKVPLLAGSEELVSKFKSQILYTPFIFCNEGFPSTNSGGGQKRAADVFREMIDGSPIYVDRKFQSPITVRAPFRLLITANNQNGMRALYGKQDLTPEDREALNIRLLHIRCGPEAAIWLRKMGGPAYTGKDGVRWVSGDAGEPSNYIVARHFRWLFENRPPVPVGNRFLVEGDANSEFVEEMSLNSGAAPAVLEILFSMIQQQTLPKGMHFDNLSSKLFVTASSILDHANLLQHKSLKDLNTKSVCDVLRGIGATHKATLDGVQRRWWDLNLVLLLREAEHGGSDVIQVLQRLRGE